jgi:hypothetical protein
VFLRYRKMSEESFLAVSTGCLHMFNDNSRTRFTNNLAKPAKSSVPWSRSLFIDIEQINFEYTPLYYENEEADLVYYDAKGRVPTTLKKCYSVQSVINQITNALSHILYIRKYSSDEKGIRTVISSYYHDVAIHRKLANLLRIDNSFEDLKKEKYFKFRKDVEYISSDAITLNCSNPSYIDLICEEIEPYFCDSEFKKIVARIDVAGKLNQTIHIDTLLRRFFKIKTSVLESITFELRQPDGRKLLMEDGAPTIIKARIKEMKTKSDFFYLQVNSKPTTAYPENTPGKFTVELPNELDLKGEWHAALAYAELPPTRNFFKDKNKILLKNRKTTTPYSFTTIQVSKETGKIFPTNITFGYGVVPFTTLLRTLRDVSNGNVEILVDEDENIQFFSKHREEMKYYIILTPDDLENFLLENFKNNDSLKKVNCEDFYDRFKDQNPSEFKKICGDHNIVSFPDFQSCYEIQKKPANHISSGKFSFTLEEYYLNEVREKNHQKTPSSISEEEANENSESKSIEEEKKLLQIYEKNYNVKKIVGKIPTWMFIYSDFVKPSLIADCYSNVLKLLPYKQNSTKGGTIFYTFTPLDFFNVNKDSLRTLSFELRSHAGEIHDFRNDYDNTSLTLFFKKIQ